jgi:threonine dehydrogenase-like Zn-dependent dehydrogenase
VYRLAKPEGAYQVVLEDVDVPEIASTEVLIRAETSLISRGSEIWRRYARQEAIDPQIMGYSMMGSIVTVGANVEGDYSMGDRVAALSPHAEYVVVEVNTMRHQPPLVVLPNDVSSEAGTFWPLGTSSILWTDELDVSDDDTVVFMGQGLVGSGCLQALRARSKARLVAVDAIPARCNLAGRLGADVVVDVSKEDPVEAVDALTDGRGADIAVYAVGGRSGPRAFEQAVDLTRRGGLIQVIGLYEDDPLPLDSGKIQGKRILGGYTNSDLRPAASDRCVQYLAEGRFAVEDMVTHRFPYQEAPEAFDLLYNRLHEAMAVLLQWQ